MRNQKIGFRLKASGDCSRRYAPNPALIGPGFRNLQLQLAQFQPLRPPPIQYRLEQHRHRTGQWRALAHICICYGINTYLETPNEGGAIEFWLRRFSEKEYTSLRDLGDTLGDTVSLSAIIAIAPTLGTIVTHTVTRSPDQPTATCMCFHIHKVNAPVGRIFPVAVILKFQQLFY